MCSALDNFVRVLALAFWLLPRARAGTIWLQMKGGLVSVSAAYGNVEAA